MPFPPKESQKLLEIPLISCLNIYWISLRFFIFEMRKRVVKSWKFYQTYLHDRAVSTDLREEIVKRRFWFKGLARNLSFVKIKNEKATFFHQDIFCAVGPLISCQSRNSISTVAPSWSFGLLNSIEWRNTVEIKSRDCQDTRCYDTLHHYKYQILTFQL